MAMRNIAVLTLMLTLSVPTLAREHSVVFPASVSLNGKLHRAQLIVRAADDGVANEQCEDLTDSATYASENPNVVTVDARGGLTALTNGETNIVIKVAEATHRVHVIVSGVNDQLDFLRDVRPILSKAGCAAGACHAAQYGQGGFKLSVFGFDPKADYDAIAHSSRGRRVNLASPADSLLLRKPTMMEHHGGGEQIKHDSVEYKLVRAWIDANMPPITDDELKVSSLEVYPQKRIGQQGYQQQLRVVAHYNDDSQRDVTALAIFDAIDKSVVSVSDGGQVKTVGKGQSGVMVRYEGQATVSTFVVPYHQQLELVDWQSGNMIDEFAAEKFLDLGLRPSPLCDDATFIRRSFLDCIGTLPSPELTQEFIDDSDPDKRQRLIDRLLGLTGDPTLDTFNDLYAAYWTLKWSDLVRNNSNSLGEQGMWAFHNWIKESFRTNKPYDQFVRELVTAQGSIYSNGPANYFRIHRNSSELTEATTQLFLGVRLECAKCHHHPFEKYSQDDYYRMAAFFSRVGSKNSEEFGLFGRETVVMVKATGDVTHPRTRKRMEPTPLDGEPSDHELDRRLPLADWLTNPKNEFFARAVVNRYMRQLLGVGLVEPVDDMRSTNPPSNAGMLDALASDFVAHDFDLKHLIRTIMTSRLYGLSSTPTEDNRLDNRFYSHFQVKRLAAEPLLDAIDQTTGVPTKFNSLPLGTRAIELPDAEYPDYFLTTFAKPRRVSVCDCERSPDANLAQVLHTLNGDKIATKITDKNGRLMKLIKANTDHDVLVTELFFAALCRPPSEAELKLSRQIVDQSANAEESYQDLLWALMNSKQYLFIR